MDQGSASPNGARRNEDIALDLLKFVSMAAGISRTSGPSTGFVASTAPKPEDHVVQLLELYSRCLGVVQGKG
ncbi:MAG TPA: hypothetical protein VGD59_04880 [Acidisarcina sp.]